MNEKLPIRIQINQQLNIYFTKIQTIVNKLEAQFNFQTLTSGWYGNEENMLAIDLYLETPLSFIEQKQMTFTGEHFPFADDVFAYYDKKDNIITCMIAFTEAELALLQGAGKQQEKVLNAFIQVKIHKVLNMLADKLSYHQI